MKRIPVPSIVLIIAAVVLLTALSVVLMLGQRVTGTLFGSASGRVTQTPPASHSALPTPTRDLPAPTSRPATVLPPEPSPTATPRPRVAPFVDCVLREGDGNYVAFFGYRNQSGTTVHIPVGPDNHFSPHPQARGQPEDFQTGESPHWPGAPLRVPFAGEELVWTVGEHTARASAASPSCVYQLHIEDAWYDAQGQPLDRPPADLPAEFRITARSELGNVTCRYPAGGQDLACAYENTTGSTASSLQVPPGTTYQVEQVGLPAGWQSMAGTGRFPGGGSARTISHVVDNRAAGAPAPSPTATASPTPATEPPQPAATSPPTTVAQAPASPSAPVDPGTLPATGAPSIRLWLGLLLIAAGLGGVIVCWTPRRSRFSGPQEQR
jgi:hypothetical protein